MVNGKIHTHINIFVNPKKRNGIGVTIMFPRLGGQVGKVPYIDREWILYGKAPKRSLSFPGDRDDPVG